MKFKKNSKMYGIITIYTYIYFFIYFITGINVRGYMNIFRKEISLQNCVMKGEKKKILAIQLQVVIFRKVIDNSLAQVNKVVFYDYSLVTYTSFLCTASTRLSFCNNSRDTRRVGPP